LLHDGKVNIEIKKSTASSSACNAWRKMTNTVILSPAEVQNLGEEIAQLTKALAGCDPQVEPESALNRNRTKI
jgi:hypothetical protein